MTIPLPEKISKPDLAELLDKLARYGTKAQRAEVERLARRGRNDERRALALELAERARRRRQVHALSMGWAFCKVEAEQEPDLLALLTTPTTTGEDVTCPACRELMGLDDAEAEAELAAEAERIARQEAEAQARAKASAEARARRALTRHPNVSTDTVDAARSGLDDRNGTDLLDPAAELAIVFPYKGVEHWATLRASAEVHYHGTSYPSPSAAGAAVTGGAVNGWRRWRYVAADKLTYPIARLRGEARDPVRTGQTGRRPSEDAAQARLAEARRRLEKATARMEAARLELARLERKHARAVEQLAKAEDTLSSLGLDSEAEVDILEEARLDDVQVRDAEARGLNGVA